MIEEFVYVAEILFWRACYGMVALASDVLNFLDRVKDFIYGFIQIMFSILYRFDDKKDDRSIDLFLLFYGIRIFRDNKEMINTMAELPFAYESYHVIIAMRRLNFFISDKELQDLRTFYFSIIRIFLILNFIITGNTNQRRVEKYNNKLKTLGVE